MREFQSIDHRKQIRILLQLSGQVEQYTVIYFLFDFIDISGVLKNHRTRIIIEYTRHIRRFNSSQYWFNKPSTYVSRLWAHKTCVFGRQFTIQ